MKGVLFFLCPTDFIEHNIEVKSNNENYFYFSLGNSFTLDSYTLTGIKKLILKMKISKIQLVLADDNKIFLNAMGKRFFFEMDSLIEVNKVIKSQKKQSELFWDKSDSTQLILSYYLNKKIEELENFFASAIKDPLIIRGKIYIRSKDQFIDILPNSICMRNFNLN